MGEAHPLHVEDLEEMCCPCGSDTCTLIPSGRCHPKDGVKVTYRKATALLELVCRHCGAFIADIAVARRSTHAAGPTPHGEAA